MNSCSIPVQLRSKIRCNQTNLIGASERASGIISEKSMQIKLANDQTITLAAHLRSSANMYLLAYTREQPDSAYNTSSSLMTMTSVSLSSLWESAHRSWPWIDSSNLPYIIEPYSSMHRICLNLKSFESNSSEFGTLRWRNFWIFRPRKFPSFPAGEMTGLLKGLMTISVHTKC